MAKGPGTSPRIRGAENRHYRKIEDNSVSKNTEEDDIQRAQAYTFRLATKTKNFGKSVMQAGQHGQPPVGATLNPKILDSSIDSSWLSRDAVPPNHTAAVQQLKHQLPEAMECTRKRVRRIFDKQIPIFDNADTMWPMDSFEKPPFPPPWPTEAARKAMKVESADTDPEGPLGPLAKQWTIDLANWYARLQKHFKFNPANLAANVRGSHKRWLRRLEHTTSW